MSKSAFASQFHLLALVLFLLESKTADLQINSKMMLGKGRKDYLKSAFWEYQTPAERRTYLIDLR